MRYQDILPITREELRSALESDDAGRASRAIIAIALHESDWQWAEQQCLNALKDKRMDVRAAAIVGLGHIARIHGKITLSRVLLELQAVKSDESLRGIAEDALDDIVIFVKEAKSGPPQ
jgi:hypothetical protein